MMRAWAPVNQIIGFDFWVVGLVGIVLLGITLPGLSVELVLGQRNSEDVNAKREQRSILVLLALGTAMILLWALGWVACPTRDQAAAFWLMNTPLMHTPLAEGLVMAAHLVCGVLLLAVIITCLWLLVRIITLATRAARMGQRRKKVGSVRGGPTTWSLKPPAEKQNDDAL